MGFGIHVKLEPIINTLSGGEAQWVKRHLSWSGEKPQWADAGNRQNSVHFDEPTTGLHFSQY